MITRISELFQLPEPRTFSSLSDYVYAYAQVIRNESYGSAAAIRVAFSRAENNFVALPDSLQKLLISYASSREIIVVRPEASPAVAFQSYPEQVLLRAERQWELILDVTLSSLAQFRSEDTVMLTLQIPVPPEALMRSIRRAVNRYKGPKLDCYLAECSTDMRSLQIVAAGSATETWTQVMQFYFDAGVLRSIEWPIQAAESYFDLDIPSFDTLEKIDLAISHGLHSAS